MNIFLPLLVGAAAFASSASIRKISDGGGLMLAPRINKFPQQSSTTKPERSDLTYKTYYYEQAVSISFYIPFLASRFGLLYFCPSQNGMLCVLPMAACSCFALPMPVCVPLTAGWISLVCCLHLSIPVFFSHNFESINAIKGLDIAQKCGSAI